MSERMVRLGFIGTGSWTRSRHLPALEYIRKRGRGDYQLELRGICSLDMAQAREVADQYGFERVYRDVEELVDDGEIDAIAVLVRPWSLEEVLEKVVPRRAPIFSEKTPGLTLDEARSMAELVDVPNVMAMNRRFCRLNNRFREIVQGMEDVYFAEAHFLRHERTDEPFAIETAVHIIDFLEYLFGSIERVRTDKFPNPRNETSVNVSRLRFAGGMYGLLKIFPCSGMLVERVEAHSNAQSAILHGPLNDDRGRITVYRAGAHGGTGEVIEGSDEMVVEQGFVDEYDEFFRVVLDGVEPRSSFQSVVSAMRIAEGIHLGLDIE